MTAFGIKTLRSLYSVRWFAGLALVPLLAALAYSQTTPPGNQESGWVMVKDWSGGPGTVSTEEFTVPSDTWRINYTMTSDQRFGFVDIVVRDPSGQQVTAAYGQQVNDPGTRSGLLTVKKAGAFRLQISSSGVDWRIRAERPESR